MFDLLQFLSHSGLYITLATILLLFLVLCNPRLMLQDYPPAIKEIVPPKTSVEKRQSTWLGMHFILMLFVFPIYGTFAFQAQIGGKAGFLSLWFYAFWIVFAYTKSNLPHLMDKGGAHINRSGRKYPKRKQLSGLHPGFQVVQQGISFLFILLDDEGFG